MVLMELNGKRALVVGLGKSGVASALFMKAHGASVTVSDTKSGDELRNEIPALLDHGITVETGGHGDRTFRGQDLIVVSPGVPVDAPPLVQARSLGETVIGEIERHRLVEARQDVHHHARRTVPALQPVAFPERLLDRVQRAVGRRDGFDRPDVGAVDLRGLLEQAIAA